MGTAYCCSNKSGELTDRPVNQVRSSVSSFWGEVYRKLSRCRSPRKSNSKIWWWSTSTSTVKGWNQWPPKSSKKLKFPTKTSPNPKSDSLFPF